jgi:hypothetical protein
MKISFVRAAIPAVTQNVLPMEYKLALLFTTYNLEATRGIAAGVGGGLHETVILIGALVR